MNGGPVTVATALGDVANFATDSSLWR